MGGLFCCKKCGEPWDIGRVYEEMSEVEREALLRGEGCPSCGFGSYCSVCKGAKKLVLRVFKESEITGEELEEEVKRYVKAFWDEIRWGGFEVTAEFKGDKVYIVKVCQRCNGTGKPMGRDERDDDEYYGGLVDNDIERKIRELEKRLEELEKKIER